MKDDVLDEIEKTIMECKGETIESDRIKYFAYMGAAEHVRNMAKLLERDLNEDSSKANLGSYKNLIARLVYLVNLVADNKLKDLPV